ncbi:MAG: hypothetical protein P1P76_01685 [Anaerolineales bacterium]|nr:hypothetical protein [Anaerolineales bacterium]
MRKRKFRSAALLHIMIFGAGLSIYGCSWLSPQVQPGEVLFQDDFAISTSGWDRYRDGLYQADYDQGSYRIEVFTPDTMVWSLPNLSYTDVILRVQTWRAAGPEDNLFGLLCRYQDADNFTFFALSSDGYVGIGQYIEGQRTLLSDESLLPVDGIRPGDNINLIEARCVSDELTLSVNGQLAAQVRSESALEGDIGLLAGTYEEPGVEIRFDNFSMLQP